MCGGAVHVAPEQLPSPCEVYRAALQGALHRDESKLELAMAMHAMVSADI